MAPFVLEPAHHLTAVMMHEWLWFSYVLLLHVLACWKLCGLGAAGVRAAASASQLRTPSPAWQVGATDACASGDAYLPGGKDSLQELARLLAAAATKDELMGALRDRHLQVSGLKAALSERLAGSTPRPSTRQIRYVADLVAKDRRRSLKLADLASQDACSAWLSRILPKD